MNRTKIEWCDKTWNPVVGCTKGCEYCYARRQAKRFNQRCQKCYDFVPHLHAERLEQPCKIMSPQRIFVGSMAEPFSADLLDRPCGLPSSLDYVFHAMEQAPWHTYILLTKLASAARDYFNERYLDPARPYIRARKIWLGVSVTNWGDNWRVGHLAESNVALRIVSFEPVHGWFANKRTTPLQWDAIDWLIIGAETGNRKGKIVPKGEWIQAAVDQARDAGVPVFVKDNVVKLYREFAGIREFPETSSHKDAESAKQPAGTTDERG